MAGRFAPRTAARAAAPGSATARARAARRRGARARGSAGGTGHGIRPGGASAADPGVDPARPARPAPRSSARCAAARPTPRSGSTADGSVWRATRTPEGPGTLRVADRGDRIGADGLGPRRRRGCWTSLPDAPRRGRRPGRLPPAPPPASPRPGTAAPACGCAHRPGAGVADPARSWNRRSPPTRRTAPGASWSAATAPRPPARRPPLRPARHAGRPHLGADPVLGVAQGGGRRQALRHDPARGTRGPPAGGGGHDAPPRGHRPAGADPRHRPLDLRRNPPAQPTAPPTRSRSATSTCPASSATPWRATATPTTRRCWRC